MPTRRVEALTRVYQDGVYQVRTRTLAVAQTLWATSPALRDSDIARINHLLIPRVQAAQIQVANLGNAYVAAVARASGVTTMPTSVNRESILGYRGAPVAEVYRRPAIQTYTALSEGKPFTEAKTAGMNRLMSIVATDIQQAKNRQVHQSIRNSGFSAYQRVLTGLENCALCVIASTQRYHRGDLMPIHPGCDCDVQPYNGDPTPQVINPELLESTHDTIAARLGDSDRGARVLAGNHPISDYLDLIVTREHGELGPTLTWHSDRFTSHVDLGLPRRTAPL